MTANNYYEISNFDYGQASASSVGTDVAGVRRFAGGVDRGRSSLSDVPILRDVTYPIKITFSPTKSIMDAFGQKYYLCRLPEASR